MNRLKNMFSGMISAGIIIVIIGLYFCIIGAGIPYQDPTNEMTIRYMANDLAGSMCLKIGIILLLSGLLGKFLSRIIKRTK